MNGAFVGMSDDPGLATAVRAIAHTGCRYRGDRDVTSQRWRGRVRRWDTCGGSHRSMDEISLTATGAGSPGLYVQIRQTDGGDFADQMLVTLQTRA